MWLAWNAAAAISAGLAAVLLATKRAAPEGHRGHAWWLVGHEVALMAALYAIWQWVHEHTVTRTAGAVAHSTWIVDAQRRMHLPSERTLQHLVLPHRWLIEALNGYYAIVHVPAVGVLLAWAYFRHRDRYGWIRNVLVLTTAASLTLQVIPVAPPRFRPDLGFVDTGLRYGQSVYGAGGSGISNQLSAMPSIHVAWAVIVAAGAIWASRSRWRWLTIAHPVLTVVAVVATANHWWLDGIVAAAIVALAAGVVTAAGRVGQARALKRVMTSPISSVSIASTASAASPTTTSSSARSALPGRRST